MIVYCDDCDRISIVPGRHDKITCACGVEINNANRIGDRIAEFLYTVGIKFTDNCACTKRRKLLNEYYGKIKEWLHTN